MKKEKRGLTDDHSLILFPGLFLLVDDYGLTWATTSSLVALDLIRKYGEF